MAGPLEVSYEQFLADTPSIMDSFLMGDGEFDLEAMLAGGGLDYVGCGGWLLLGVGDSVVGGCISSMFSDSGPGGTGEDVCASSVVKV